jgi:hypothetical protein
MRLDESLSGLEPEKERLARKELSVCESHGSVKSFVKEVLKNKRDEPTI